MRLAILLVTLTAFLPIRGVGQDRIPGEHWMRYVDVADAGFSADKLARAREYWDSLDSSAFLAVSGGAVVASWGDVERRFMCHSVRKSFLSALYGVFRDEIDFERTLAELEIDDREPLSDQEKTARVWDLIRARSGVYHPAAYEPESMSKSRPARGSHEPGRHWWYNNWDFNTAMVVFEKLTGERIFEAFGATIAQPIGMQDYRVSDGYYHLEPEKSVHPAYPFRMSTRDLARFGLLFARGGRWGDAQVIPEDWVKESTREHSQDRGGTGYGYMWWTHGKGEGFSARGSGGQILAVFPGHDVVMAIRADTYRGKSVSNREWKRVFGMVTRALEGERSETPELVAMTSRRDTGQPTHRLSPQLLEAYPCEIQMDSGRKVTLAVSGEALTIDYGTGEFRLWPESDTRFVAEDSEAVVLLELGANGRVDRIWVEHLCYMEAVAARDRGDLETVLTWVTHAADRFPGSPQAHLSVAQVLIGTGRPDEALPHLQQALEIDPDLEQAKRMLESLDR